MIIHCPQCNRDIEAPNTALSKRVQCPLCGQAFTATLPKAVVLEDAAPSSLEMPPPGFADYHAPPTPARASASKPGRTGDLIAHPVDDDDLDVAELTDVVELPAAARPAARPSGGPSEIIDALQGRGQDDEGPMSETLAALHGRAPSQQDIDDNDPDVLTTELAEEEVDEALSALAGVGRSTVGAAYSARAKRNQWYVVSDEVEYGPYSGQAILAAVQAGKLSPQTILHDGDAEVEVSVAQLIQALIRRGRSGQPRSAGDVARPRTKRVSAPRKAPRPAQPSPSTSLGVAADPAASESAAPTHGASPSADDSVAALAGLLAATDPGFAESGARPSPSAGPAPSLAQAATAAFSPPLLSRRLPWTLSDTALSLTGLALAATAAAILLPWLARAPSLRTGLRLSELARPWAFAFGALTLGGFVLTGALLVLRRWHGRRLACGALLVLCLANLVVQSLALFDIRETFGTSVHPGMWGTGAWLAAAGALAAGILAALAMATTEPRSNPRA